MSPPRLQYIKDHCLAATTASASPIRPQITPSKRNLSDLPLCEISSSSDLPRAATRHQKSRRHSHAPLASTTHRHSLPRACTRQCSSADVSPRWRHLPRHRWRHLPRHPLTSSTTVPADVIVDLTVDFDSRLTFSVQVLLTQFFA